MRTVGTAATATCRAASETMATATNSVRVALANDGALGTVMASARNDAQSSVAAPLSSPSMSQG